MSHIEKWNVVVDIDTYFLFSLEEIVRFNLTILNYNFFKKLLSKRKKFWSTNQGGEYKDSDVFTIT